MLKNQSEQNHSRRMLWVVLLVAFVLRAGLTLATKGYPYDTSCFFAWGMRMADVGAGGFYADDYFCDYPPAYLYVLGLVAKLMTLFKLSYLQKGAALLLTLVPTLADCAIAATLYHVSAPRHGGRLALRFAGAAALCPMLLFDTAVWKQIDSVFALCMLLCFVLLEEKKYLPAAAFYGLSLAIKPQALLVGPVLALCFLEPLLFAETKKNRVDALKNIALGVVCALAPVVVCALPFFGVSGLVSGLLSKYFTTASSYPYATINAFNFMAFLGGGWVSQSANISLFGGAVKLFSWQQLGVVSIAVLSVYTAWLFVRARRHGRFSALVLASFYAIAIFTFSHRMHERYLIFGIVLLAAAAARFGSRRLLALAGGFSLTVLLNLAVVYTVVGTDDEFLTSATSKLMMRGTGLAETVLFVLLAKEIYRLCTGEPVALLTLPEKVGFVAAPAPQPKWTRKEGAALAGLTLLAAVVSFVYLGDVTAPETCLDANSGSFSETVFVAGDAAELWVYPGIATDNNGYLTVTAGDGSVAAEMTLSYGSPFSWTKYTLSPAESYTVSLGGGQVFELAFKDADGNVLPVTETAAGTSGVVTGGAAADGVSALFDESGAVPRVISQLNGFYFDEIYHARTGYEMLHGMKVYETTHPPLGKDFIALGIAIFGMTGFGWRFFGTLFGVLMVPVLYLAARRLTRKPWLALFAGALLACDFMRFSQSRIATIDTYGAFFILLAAYWMIVYAQSVLARGVTHSVLPMALGGVAFGLGCASKWTGIYAGAGLACVYFVVLYRRGVQLCGAQSGLGAEGRRFFKKECALAIGGGVLFFVLVPVLIYLASYLPYRLRDPSFGLESWWECQKYMYWYHSSLEATHPFSSPWYSWAFDLRPVWYYMNGRLPAGHYGSIAGFFNPLVVWLGLAAMLTLFVRGLVGRSSAESRMVMTFYLSSLLPWMLVTRCTFLYHYFPCMPFLILALALCLAKLSVRKPRRAKQLALCILAAAAVLFVWFYPVLSGLPVGKVWAASTKWLSSWGFYIL